MGRANPGARVEELTKRLESYRAEAQELEKRGEVSEDQDDTSSVDGIREQQAERLELLRESLIPDCQQELEYWKGQM